MTSFVHKLVFCLTLAALYLAEISYTSENARKMLTIFPEILLIRMYVHYVICKWLLPAASSSYINLCYHTTVGAVLFYDFPLCTYCSMCWYTCVVCLCGGASAAWVIAAVCHSHSTLT